MFILNGFEKNYDGSYPRIWIQRVNALRKKAGSTLKFFVCYVAG